MQHEPIQSREPCRVLVLQGGGALGAYQAGVYQGLSEADFKPQWIAGTSIGAINAAIIAGNAPEERLAKLRAFWAKVSDGLPFALAPDNIRQRSFINDAAAGWVAAMGVDGFFKPRFPPAVFYPPGAPQAISVYDTEPLRETLAELVDFDRINAKEIRISLGAVDVQSGKLEYFDNTSREITPAHVMASGALPPGFPPIAIEGRYYWDGGVVSNTPLQHVLDQETGRDLLIYEVDLFNAQGRMPRTIIEAYDREKDIRFASRAENHGRAALEKADAKMAIQKFLDTLPPELLNTPEAARVKVLARHNAITLVLLVYRNKPYEGASKDYEFSRQSMLEHWAAGHADICKKLEKSDHMTCDRSRGAPKLIDDPA